MNLRTQTSLFCGALAVAIAVSILLRGRPRRTQLWFAGFALDVGLWYLAQWLYHAKQVDLWVRFTAILAVLLPQFGLRLFEALLPEPERRSTLGRFAAVSLPVVLALVLFGPLGKWWLRGIVFAYVFGLLTGGLWSLGARAAATRSRATRRRVQFLVFVGAVAVATSLADFLWFLGFDMPPIGAVFSILFLFVLSESLIRQRFVDIYDVLSQVMLSAALATCLAAIFYVFVDLFGGFDTMYPGAFLATILILVLFEPLREKANAAIQTAFFRERADLARAVARVRAELVHVVRVEQLEPIVMGALEASRRATGAAIYLRDRVGSHFQLSSNFGPQAPERIVSVAARPLIDRLAARPSVDLEELARDVALGKRRGRTPETDADERVLAAGELLGAFRQGVCLSLRGEKSVLLGFLVVMDDRIADAYSRDEVLLLESLALQMGIVVENSRQFQQMQDRDRLAVLGQMAAGLAHEVKNPLGAIKGAAQLLNEGDRVSVDESDREFLGIILEEVDRLDRVVGSVLDYARPAKGNPGPVDVNAIVERTVRVLGPEHPECDLVLELEQHLPEVRVDAEQLRQVVINLVRNATQAMHGEGTVTVSTRSGGEGERSNRRSGDWPFSERPFAAWVEVSVRDEGPGVDPEVMENLFVPFVTTKDRGTGLGLAISQRIVAEMGGRIDVTSRAGQGSAFTVVLPVDQSQGLASKISPMSASVSQIPLGTSPDEAPGDPPAREGEHGSRRGPLG